MSDARTSNPMDRPVESVGQHYERLLREKHAEIARLKRDLAISMDAAVDYNNEVGRLRRALEKIADMGNGPRAKIARAALNGEPT